MIPPTLADLQAAQKRIKQHVHRTPVMRSQQLDAETGAQVFFKCEHLQRTGAFKARGAMNAVLGLSRTDAPAGVATHSSGNHGAALALAARSCGLPAYVVMPANAAAVKKDAVASYGGKIIDCEPTLAAREAALAVVLKETGAQAVHPYNDARIIAGQGTAALELMKQAKDLDVLVVPVGGGGLLAGTAIAVKGLNPRIEVMAIEPEGADDAFRSFGLGELQPQTNPDTIADGLRAGLGELNFEIIRKQVDTIVTVPDLLVVTAMQLLWSRMKQVVEPSGAVSFAGLLEYPERFRGRRVGVVLSGGNVDLDRLPW